MNAPHIRTHEMPASDFQKIAVLDTSVTSENLGDQIIMDASRSVLKELFPNAFFINFPTHEFFLWESYRMLKGCDKIFVGGSNLLKSKMAWNNQWKISPADILLRRNCILLGCGWWHYQPKPDLYSRIALRAVLSKEYSHSVRDSYAKKQLEAAGVKNVRNTACVTMWKLSSAHCEQIPVSKAPQAVLSITQYKAKPVADRALIDLLLREYQDVYLWVQQPEDYAYAMELSGGRLKVLPPNLQAYNDFLSTHHVDVIGSRLHGGIRALQLAKRTLVLAIDNRAFEISRDTGLPVKDREDLAAIEAWVTGVEPTVIRLPQADIDSWKLQFARTPTQQVLTGREPVLAHG